MSGFLDILGVQGVATAGEPAATGGFIDVLALLGVGTAALESGGGLSATWLRDVLETVRDAVAGALPDTPIIHDNASIPTLAASWARVTATIDSMTVATIGPDHYRAIGTVTVNVFVPRARGDAVAIAAAGDVCDALRLTRTADPFVIFRAPSIVGGVEFSEAWAMRTVRAAFSAEGDGMKVAS